MPAPYTGGCLCGAVRYRLREEPLTLYACHCTDCQRRTGSACGLSMFVRKQGVGLEQGRTAGYRAALADGRVKAGQLCAACGSRLWGEPAAAPHILVLQPGTLDDTSWLRPVAHLWTRSAQPWMVFPPDVPRFETQPEDRSVLFTLWRTQHP